MIGNATHNSKLKKSTVLIYLVLTIVVISNIFVHEFMFAYFKIKNGNQLSKDLILSSEFSITGQKSNVISLIRNLGHPYEQIAVIDISLNKFDYEKALNAGEVELIKSHNPNCLVYKTLKTIPTEAKFSYFLKHEKLLFLVIQSNDDQSFVVEHGSNEIELFCQAVTHKYWTAGCFTSIANSTGYQINIEAFNGQYNTEVNG